MKTTFSRRPCLLKDNIIRLQYKARNIWVALSLKTIKCYKFQSRDVVKYFYQTMLVKNIVDSESCKHVSGNV